MHTQDQSEIFITLDGLRGVAALAVVIFHVNGILSGFDFSALLIPHAYLAVDFFFMLSGFVIAYTYDKRWRYLSTTHFFQLRLMRLHPLVLLAMLLGLLCNLCNPFDESTLAHRLPAVMLVFVLGLFMIPSPSATPQREDATFSLNSPLWSLSLEYCANILYAFGLRKMCNIHLAICAALCSLALIVMVTTSNSFVGGFSWSTLWVAPFRILPPFLLGVLCARSSWRVSIRKVPFPMLALLLLALLAAPVLPQAPGFSVNGLYDALCVVVAFPLLIMAGASVPRHAAIRAACALTGRLSYPLYIIHMPFVYIYADYIKREQPEGLRLFLYGTLLIAIFLLMGWLAEKYWDQPLRKKWKACYERRPRANTGEIS